MRSNDFAAAIKVISMITYRLHALGLACIVDVVRIDLTLNCHTFDLTSRILEGSVLFHEVWIALPTESVAIALSIVTSPPV
jgi:hypothetical protein